MILLSREVEIAVSGEIDMPEGYIPRTESMREVIRKAIIRESAAAQACAMELKTFGDVKFTADEYMEARTQRMNLEAN